MKPNSKKSMFSAAKKVSAKVAKKVVKAATVRETTDDQSPFIPDAIIRDGIRFEQAPIVTFGEKAKLVEFILPQATSFLEKLVSMSHEAEKNRLTTLAQNPEALKASFENETRQEANAQRYSLLAGRLSARMYLGTVQAVFGTLNQIVAKVDFNSLLSAVVASNARVQDRNDRELSLRERESEARMAIEKVRAEVEAEKQRARNAEDAKEAALRLQRDEFRLAQEKAKAQAEADADSEMEKVRKARQDSKLGMS